MAETEVEQKEGFLDKAGRIFKELNKAVTNDKTAQRDAEKTGEKLENPNEHVKAWAIKYWWVVLLGFIVIIGMVQEGKPRYDRKNPHHGISRFTGRKY